MVMEVHATSLPVPDQESMTAASGDVGVTESHSTDHLRQPSYACDQTWTDFFKSLGQADHDPNQTSNMDLQYFGFEDPMQTQVGAMNDPTHPLPQTLNDPQSASSTSSVNSSLSFDAKDMPQAFQSPLQPLNHQYVQFGSYEQAPYQQPGQWISGHGFEPQMNYGFPQDHGLGIQMPPTSNPVPMAVRSYHENNFVGHHSPIDRNEGFNKHDFRPWAQPDPSAPAPDIFEDNDDEEGVESTDPCYAQLLYKCLKEAPNNTLSLRELYEWVDQHSQKAKDPKNRGWQNSVRHNLSMNAAFVRVQHGSTGSKKGSLWCLTDDALRDGVISTTRYRKDPKRKPERRAVPAPNRQTSGAKGGRATRDASRLRQQQQNRIHGMPYSNRHRRHHRNGPAYSPYSIHSAPNSPVGQPPFMQHMSTPQPPSHMSSPYFSVVEEQPQFGGELTPTGFALPGQQHPPPDNLFQLDDPSKSSSVTNFDFLQLDLSQDPLFGDHDPELGFNNPHTPTPSLMTEESFLAEDNVPALMSCGTSRETSTFQ